MNTENVWQGRVSEACSMVPVDRGGWPVDRADAPCEVENRFLPLPSIVMSMSDFPLDSVC